MKTSGVSFAIVVATILAAGCQDDSKNQVDAGCPEALTGELAWAVRAGGAEGDVARSVAPLADGTFLVTGYFHEEAVFGAGEPNETTLTEVDEELAAGFVARYDGDGQLVWARKIGPQGFRMAAHDDGSFAVMGTFEESVVFGAGEPAETALTSVNYHDFFLARYSADGALEWVRQAATNGFPIPFGITMLPDGSALVTGTFASFDPSDNTIAFDDGDGGNDILASHGGGDVFIARYNLEGVADWVAQAGGGGDDRAMDIAATADGAFAIVGSFGGGSWDYTGPNYSANFGEPGDQVLLTTVGDPISEDMFIASYDADRNLLWAESAGSEDAHAEGNGVAALGDGAYLFTAMSCWGAVFGEGSTEIVFPEIGGGDIYFGEYDQYGELSWIKQAGGPSADEGRRIVSLADGGFLLGGYFSSHAVFGWNEPGETQLDSLGEEDVFAARFAADGTLVWAVSGGSTDYDLLEGMASTTCDAAILVVGFDWPMTFGLGEANETTLESAGDKDIFIAKLGP